MNTFEKRNPERFIKSVQQIEEVPTWWWPIPEQEWVPSTPAEITEAVAQWWLTTEL
jgi:hypothetical protein